MAKKILDLDGLTRYDGKIKQVIGTKQDTLVSGTNIKTVNNTSILGSGNINIDTTPTSITTQEVEDLFDEEESEQTGD